jgi:hypothetical protein
VSALREHWFYEALLIAESEDQLLPGTDCQQLSQLLAASQWGVTLMWQKGLISTDTLKRQAIIKHCVDLMPFCETETAKWLADLLSSTTKVSRRRTIKEQSIPAQRAN